MEIISIAEYITILDKTKIDATITRHSKNTVKSRKFRIRTLPMLSRLPSLSLGGIPLLFSLAILPTSALAATPDIFISQVQIEGEQTSDDFVAIRNDEHCAVDLSGWKLRKRTASGSESSVRVFGNGSILPPGETFIWASSTENFADTIKANEQSSATLARDNAIALLDGDSAIIDSIAWGVIQKPFRLSDTPVENPGKNESVYRAAAGGPASAGQTEIPRATSLDGGDFDLCGASKDRAEQSSVVLSEILADPSGDENENEFIEIENRGEAPVDLSKWTLRDASKTGKYTFPSGASIETGKFSLLRRSDFTFALNNTDETVSLEDARGKQADSVSWTNSKESVSLARDGARWRNTRFLTPGETNRFDREPSAKTKLSRSGFAGIAVDFSANIRDLDRDPTKVIWDFGDGHRSYKKKTTHVYGKEGRYRASLRYTDGTSDIEKRFTVKIENYHAPKVRITEIVPNPAGKDTGREYLILVNRSRKTVDMRGWFIATKSRTKTKNFVNHEIKKSFILKPGESKRITSEYAAFALGNTRQYVELRDPRKKTAQKIRYKLEKSAPDESVYSKEPGAAWKWRIPETP